MANNVLKPAAAGGLLYAARRYYLNWGTTKDECRMRIPGDELVRSPVIQTTEGVWIDAPPGAVWPWLVQMGQDRGGLYTYETVENLVGLDYHSADRIHPDGSISRPATKCGWCRRAGWACATASR